jgi:FkbM family methyltransferase
MTTLIKYSFQVIGFKDKVHVLYSELYYLFMRILLRTILGKKQRDEWFSNKKIGRASKVNKKEILIKNEQGLKYWIRPTEWDFFVVSTECEPAVLSKFTPKEGDVVIDVGANIGKYAINSGNLVGNIGKVYAFEPSQRPFELLCKSIKENKLENTVIPIQAAVSNKEGKSKLYLSDQKPITSLIFKLSDNFIEVETTTLDSFIIKNNLKKIDWIKIDVEGAEYEVLSGAINTLKNYNINLIFEVLEVNKEKVLHFLEGLGYIVSMLDSYHTEEFTNKGFSNFLARKHID